MPAQPSSEAPPERPEPVSLVLAADFPAATRDEWRALVSAVLAKSGVEGDPEEALAHTTYDGIVLKPLYTPADGPGVDVDGLPGHPPFLRGATAEGSTERGWDVRTRHAGADPTAANAAVLADLETGATSLWLTVGDGAIGAGDLARVLDGVYLELAPIVLDAGAHSEEAEQALLALAEHRGVDPAQLRGSLGLDPIGLRARTGAPGDVSVLRGSEQSKQLTGMQRATVDATVYHDAGASDAQELGIAAAVGVAYLRELTDAGSTLDEALAALEFRWAVTAEQFPSIAKLRAARRVWDRIAELSGAADDRRGQRQHAVTSAAMLTKRDPWVNMLRTTIACFAAAVGGADAITVHPFDAAIGVSDDFARRIARNTHAVLHDESSLARVIDAGGGSWLVESLTDALAEKAWDVFTGIERAGGALAALDDGTIEELIAGTRARRADDVAHRRAPITGVSEFAYVGEQPVERPPGPSVPEGLLPRVRYAEEFEGLRDRSDEWAAASGARPKVFLATLGPVSQHSARAGYVANLLAAGGIEAVPGPVEDFAAADTNVACVCSSDNVYADRAEPAVEALRAAGAKQIWLAGRGDVDGVDGTMFAGCDALAVLSTIHDALGVSP
jgi:methylmalonyl-CoA mutase